MKYRTRAEIISQMLGAAKEDLNGVTKTKIMYEASITFAQSKEYLKLVLDRGLLEHNVSTRRYKLTDKGVEYLQMFHQVKQLTGIY